MVRTVAAIECRGQSEQLYLEQSKVPDFLRAIALLGARKHPSDRTAGPCRVNGLGRYILDCSCQRRTKQVLSRFESTGQKTISRLTDRAAGSPSTELFHLERVKKPEVCYQRRDLPRRPMLSPAMSYLLMKKSRRQHRSMISSNVVAIHR